MVRTKKIVVNCSACNSNIELKIPINVAQNREYYPFEYIDIHGSPQHALMLFLDKHLTVRDTVVYTDLSVARSHAKEFTHLVQMSENEALGTIYSDPLRLKILNTLTDGPIIEDDLIEILKQEKNFRIQDFKTLMIPFIKTGLIATSWLHNTFFECYFLVKDFLVTRIPPKSIINIISILNKIELTSNYYFRKLESVFQEYQHNYIEDLNMRIKEIQFCFKLLNDKNYIRVMDMLRKDILRKNKISRSSDKKILQELISQNFVDEIEVRGKNHYALLCDITINKFTPRYLLTTISEKLKNQDISQEMAIKHLDLLYSSEIK